MAGAATEADLLGKFLPGPQFAGGVEGKAQMTRRQAGFGIHRHQRADQSIGGVTQPTSYSAVKMTGTAAFTRLIYAAHSRTQSAPIRQVADFVVNGLRRRYQFRGNDKGILSDV